MLAGCERRSCHDENAGQNQLRRDHDGAAMAHTNSIINHLMLQVHLCFSQIIMPVEERNE